MGETVGRELKVGDIVVGECVAWSADGRGYGFIRVQHVKRNLFAPARNLLASAFLEPGDVVRCEVRMGYDGRLMADQVELVEAAKGR